MKIITAPTNFNTLELFPLDIENDEFVFFHGTNEFYSSDIEKYGLHPNSKLLAHYFYDLITFCDDIYSFFESEGINNPLFKNYRDIKSYFNNFLRLSFSPVSLIAASYTVGNTVGGQAFSYLRDLQKIILESNYSCIPDSVIEISDLQIYRLNNLDSYIDSITKSNGIVYVVKFDRSDINELYFEDGILYYTKHLKQKNIIAKMIIPQNTVILDNIIEDGLRKTKSIFSNNPSTLLGKINENSKVTNIVDYLKSNT